VLPPHLLRQVAVSTWPGLLLRQVALVWALLVVLPWVQQYPRLLEGGRDTGAVPGAWVLRRAANSVNSAKSLGPEGRAVAARAVPSVEGMVVG
jgi:hypothetical protein